MSERIWSYPKVLALGHAGVTGILSGEVVVQEKYDGSQLSWAWIDGELHVRSKGKEQHGNGAVVDKMFRPAIDYLLDQEPFNGPVFRGEFFSKPKHNTLAYPRMPKNGLILYDVEDGPQGYSDILAHWAGALEIEVAQQFDVPEDGDLLSLLEQESSLGGPMEGIVIKNYARFGRDGKALMAKLVREDFKEKHTRDWKERNPNRSDILAAIVTALDTEARYEKAVQHLRDDGRLEQSPRDIGALMKEVKRDTIDEEREWIIEKLATHFMPQVERALGRGLPNWYKAKLAETALEEVSA
jgi:hypothetical protein